MKPYQYQYLEYHLQCYKNPLKEVLQDIALYYRKSHAIPQLYPYQYLQKVNQILLKDEILYNVAPPSFHFQ